MRVLLDSELSKMVSSSLMEKRERLQKTMMKTFQAEVQTLDKELQRILIDDMVTAFCNRLKVMEKIGK
jgi:hypothetical protein